MAQLLEGRVGLVTGGGRGIGRAIALEFAREGAKVAVSSRTQGELNSVVNEIRGLGGDGYAVVADNLDRAAIKQLVADVIEHFGRLDILVNNAGGGPFKKLEDVLAITHDDQVFEDHLFLNLTSAYYATRAALPPMVKQSRRRSEGRSRTVALFAPCLSLGRGSLTPNPPSISAAAAAA